MLHQPTIHYICYTCSAHTTHLVQIESNYISCMAVCTYKCISYECNINHEKIVISTLKKSRVNSVEVVIIIE